MLLGTGPKSAAVCPTSGSARSGWRHVFATAARPLPIHDACQAPMSRVSRRTVPDLVAGVRLMLVDGVSFTSAAGGTTDCLTARSYRAPGNHLAGDPPSLCPWGPQICVETARSNLSGMGRFFHVSCSGVSSVTGVLCIVNAWQQPRQVYRYTQYPTFSDIVGALMRIGVAYGAPGVGCISAPGPRTAESPLGT